MTTTPTASPELPDIDRLEALARAADPYGVAHLVTHYRLNANLEAEEAWRKAATPAAVLALIALARRAQPEGEAPQAEKCAQCSGHFMIYREDREVPCPSCQVVDDDEIDAPAAQHAESGAQAGEHCDHPAFLKVMDDILTPQGLAKFNADEDVNLNREFAGAIFMAGLAAQSQGAPAGYVRESTLSRLGSTDFTGTIWAKPEAEDYVPVYRAALAAKAEAPADDLRKLIKERDGWKEEAEHQKALYERACRQIELLKEHERGHVWMWQGDGSDNLASMSNGMAVLIRADQLRAQQAAAPGALYSYMGESGQYELLGKAVGAGKLKLVAPLTVYRDTATGSLYFRDPADFAERMVAQKAAAPTNTPEFGGIKTSAPGTPEAPKPPFPISDEEMTALRRFWECATDGEGYDVEKSMMQRLAEMGLVQRKSGAYYMSTDFGLYVLGEYTMERAAQLDGGQEESESNG